MNEKKKTPLIFILVGLIIALLAILWAADTVGFIDLRQSVGQTPVLQKLFPQTDVGDGNKLNIPVVSPIEEENKSLREAVKALEEKIVALESEKTKMLITSEQLQTELTELRNYKTEKENQGINAKELAAYYQEMKPDAAIKVLSKLDDETAILILTLLETEQTGKILSLMEPERAALITQLLLKKQ